MLSGMSTIEIIENLKSKNYRKLGDTTVRMTADDISLLLHKFKILMHDLVDYHIVIIVLLILSK